MNSFWHDLPDMSLEPLQSSLYLLHFSYIILGPTICEGLSQTLTASVEKLSRIYHPTVRCRILVATIRVQPPEAPAQAHTQALNLTEGMCAPAMAWLAWSKVFRGGFDALSWHGFSVVSRFDFCQQILSADFSCRQICFLSADSVSRFF